jgi:hypothetical protein
MPVLKILLNECGKQLPDPNFEIKILSVLQRIIHLWLLRNLHDL